MYCPWPKKLRLSEALFSVLSPKKLRIRKKLKTEHKKLSLSEGRAYKFLQKFGEKSLIYFTNSPCLGCFRPEHGTFSALTETLKSTVSN